VGLLFSINWSGGLNLSIIVRSTSGSRGRAPPSLAGAAPRTLTDIDWKEPSGYVMFLYSLFLPSRASQILA